MKGHLPKRSVPQSYSTCGMVILIGYTNNLPWCWWTQVTAHLKWHHQMPWGQSQEACANNNQNTHEAALAVKHKKHHTMKSPRTKCMNPNCLKLGHTSCQVLGKRGGAEGKWNVPREWRRKQTHERGVAQTGDSPQHVVGYCPSSLGTFTFLSAPPLFPSTWQRYVQLETILGSCHLSWAFHGVMVLMFKQLVQLHVCSGCCCTMPLGLCLKAFDDVIWGELCNRWFPSTSWQLFV